MAKTPRGVRQIGENVLQKGRAFIVTEEDFDKYNWADIPNGSLHVDAETGMISVKLEGETTWVPSGLKNDGTVVIARDSQVCEEVFKIISLDDGNGNFVYENADGEKRHKPVIGKQEKFVFELENGTYLMGRNHLEIKIDDILTRTVASGGIEEISESRFSVNEKLEVGHEITARYVRWTKIGNPYPRIFMNKEEPERPEIGDIWIDPNGNFDEGSLNEILTDNPEMTIKWSQISGKPTTVAGYGIKDPVEMKGHVHRTLDITDFPTSLPALGGDADSVKGKVPGNGPGNLVTIGDKGYLDINLFPTNFLIDSGAFYIQDGRPSAVKNGVLWICTDEVNDSPHMEVFYRNKWIKIGGIWK